MSDQVSGSFTWSSAQLSSLRISRDGTPVRLAKGKVELVFKDPRKKSEIEKILLDPTYRPGDAGDADFFLTTTITSPVSKKKVSETSLCYWNEDPSRVSNKSVAVCSIEDDGGRYLITVDNRSSSLTSSQFAFVVLPLNGYSGFRIAQDEPVGKEPPEPHPIDVKLKTASPVRSDIKF